MSLRWRGLLPRRSSVAPQYTRDAYPQYDIGIGTYGLPKVREWGEGAQLRIGKYCSISTGVQLFLGGNHRSDWVTTYPFNILWKNARHFKGHPATKGDIVIGHDVWIGAEAVILSGVTVHSGAVIGTRAVVTKDVSPYAIVGGNPARKIGQRFDEDTVRRLLALEWWNWDDRMIHEMLPLMLNTDISAFLDLAERSTRASRGVNSDA